MGKRRHDKLVEDTALAADRQRLERLVKEHSAALLGYLLRRTDVPEDASDALADVMVVAWRRLDDVPPGEEARPWLYGVARRVLANTHRASTRRARLGERLRHELTALTPREPDDRHEAQAVRAAIRKLPEGDREVLLLSAWEGLEPAQIATVIGVPAGTARTRLSRARKRLHDELEAMQVGA